MTSRTQTDTHTPRTLGGYQLIKKLGQGGMAEVFLAYRRGPAGCGPLLVLKRLRSHLAHREGWQHMLLGEAKVAARLNHPNIVQTYDVSDLEDARFITMEHLEGRSLAQLMNHFRRRRQRLPYGIVCFIVADILEGLDYAHNLEDFDGTPLHIVHRDVSPQNLFVTYTGQAKLLDFGVAQATILTEHGNGRTIKGKLAYLAPEQARQQTMDHRADLWSTGVVLWEALAGRRLFRGETKVETLANSLKGEIPSLCGENSAVPATLDHLVQSALQRSQDHRIPSAQEFSCNLRPFASHNRRLLHHQDVAAFLEYHLGDEIREERREFRQLLCDATANPPPPVETPVELPPVPTPWAAELATETLQDSSQSASSNDPISVSLDRRAREEPTGRQPWISRRTRPPLAWSESAGMLIISVVCAIATSTLFLGLYWIAPAAPAEETGAEERPAAKTGPHDTSHMGGTQPTSPAGNPHLQSSKLEGPGTARKIFP